MFRTTRLTTRVTNRISERPEVAIASPGVVGDLQVPQTGHGGQQCGRRAGQPVAVQRQAVQLVRVPEPLGPDGRQPATVQLDGAHLPQPGEQAVVERAQRVAAEDDFPQPRGVLERGRVQRRDAVLGHVQLGERVQAAERVLVHASHGTVAHGQRAQVSEARGPERVRRQLADVVVGNVQRLRLGAEVPRHYDETRARAVGPWRRDVGRRGARAPAARTARARLVVRTGRGGRVPRDRRAQQRGRADQQTPAGRGLLEKNKNYNTNDDDSIEKTQSSFVCFPSVYVAGTV